MIIFYPNPVISLAVLMTNDFVNYFLLNLIVSSLPTLIDCCLSSHLPPCYLILKYFFPYLYLFPFFFICNCNLLYSLVSLSFQRLLIFRNNHTYCLNTWFSNIISSVIIKRLKPHRTRSKCSSIRNLLH